MKKWLVNKILSKINFYQALEYYYTHMYKEDFYTYLEDFTNIF